MGTMAYAPLSTLLGFSRVHHIPQPSFQSAYRINHSTEATLLTSPLRWIVVRSLHSFFSTYLLSSILSIIPPFLLVFKIGSVLMVFLLIGSYYKHFKISTYHTITRKTTLASYQPKHRLQNLSSHIQNTYKPTYLYNSLSFPSHSVSTRSSDSLVFFIPYVPIITWKKSILCHRSTTLEFNPSWYPKLVFLYQYSVPGSKHTFSKLLSFPMLFPISLNCLPGFLFLLFSFYALSNDT